MANKREKKCRTKKCDNIARQLGVCSTCYSVIRRAVLLDQMTWDEAEERKLIERTNKPSPMQAAIKEIIGGKHDCNN